MQHVISMSFRFHEATVYIKRIYYFFINKGLARLKLSKRKKKKKKKGGGDRLHGTFY